MHHSFIAFCLVIYSQSTLRVQYTMHWHDRSCLCIHIPQFFCCLFQIMLVPHPKPQPMYSLNNYYHTTVYSNLTKCFALFPLMPLLPTVVLSLREDSLFEVLIFCLEECDPRSTNGWQSAVDLSKEYSKYCKCKSELNKQTNTVCGTL